MSPVKKRCLSIYVTRDCPACGTARGVATEVAQARPDIQVELVYLDDGGIPPPMVFGVPTYVWQGRVVSLGNPHLEELLTAIGDAQERRGSHDDSNR
jgi:hypothetical protein